MSPSYVVYTAMLLHHETMMYRISNLILLFICLDVDRRALLDVESNFAMSDSLQSTKRTCLETIFSIVNSARPSTSVLSHLSTISKSLIFNNAKANTEIQSMLPDLARKGNLRMIQFLSNIMDLDVNIRGRQDMTALHFAARGGKVEIVEWILDSCPKVDVNALDGVGKKAVDYAMANGRDDIAFLLTEFDAKKIDF